MAFLLGNGIWNGIFAVPNDVVDTHLKIASGLSVKVLLLLLRHQGNIEPADMANILGQSPADIQDALNYWSQCGIVAAAESATESIADSTPPPAAHPAIPAPSPAPPLQEAPGPPPSEERKIQTITARRSRLSPQEINDMAKNDNTIPHLLQESQDVLGQPLTPLFTETIISMYSYYGMQPDLILLLLHYCVRIGKDNIHYIEKLAADWMTRDIDSHEKAEAEIQRLTQRNSMEGKIKSIFGIERNLVAREKNYIKKWTEEYHLDLSLITMAFERCVELKDKLSFAYINGILTNWHNKGITTPAQAAQEFHEHSPQEQSSPPPAANASYDINEIEQLIASGKF